MLHPKFIVVGDNIYMGKVTFHKELLNEGDKPVGGGWFYYKQEDNSFTFYGDSHDFGRANIEDIRKAVLLGNVGDRRRSQRLRDHIFYYCYDIGLLSERELLSNIP